MQIEYPFLRYDLFYYVCVLSFYERAHSDTRFREAFGRLESKFAGGNIVVESPNRQLAEFTFCRKGEQSTHATKRCREIRRNSGTA